MVCRAPRCGSGLQRGVPQLEVPNLFARTFGWVLAGGILWGDGSGVRLTFKSTHSGVWASGMPPVLGTGYRGFDSFHPDARVVH